MNISVSELSEGYALFTPIRDDMLRTYHKKPQVIKKKKNILSREIFFKLN